MGRSAVRRIASLLGCTALHAFNMWRSSAFVAGDPVMSSVFHGCTLALNMVVCVAGVVAVAWAWMYRRHLLPAHLLVVAAGLCTYVFASVWCVMKKSSTRDLAPIFLGCLMAIVKTGSAVGMIMVAIAAALYVTAFDSVLISVLW